MDEEDRLISELDSEQARAIDSIIGKRIYNMEILEDGEQSVIRIELSNEDGDAIVIHGDGIDMYIINGKPKVLN